MATASCLDQLRRRGWRNRQQARASQWWVRKRHCPYTRKMNATVESSTSLLQGTGRGDRSWRSLSVDVRRWLGLPTSKINSDWQRIAITWDSYIVDSFYYLYWIGMLAFMTLPSIPHVCGVHKTLACKRCLDYTSELQALQAFFGSWSVIQLTFGLRIAWLNLQNDGLVSSL